MTTLIPVARGRRRKDAVARGLIGLATLIAVVPLVLVVFFLLKRGLGAVNGSFFTSDPTGNFFGDQGGVRSAIAGTIEMVALAAAIAIPLGVGVALYLVEFGKKSRFALAVRYFVDVMTGVPSIVFGLFIYITLVLTGFAGASFSGFKGSLALALLMLPVVARSAEVVLSLVPDALREAALALGAPRWRVTFKVVLPTALPGLITGSLLAVARGMGETAPLLFTAAAVNGLSFNLGQRMNSLPAQIFADISSPNAQLVQRAWGSALVLVALVFLLTLIARVAQRRSRLT
jgi:phosphate transport system permease protein